MWSLLREGPPPHQLALRRRGSKAVLPPASIVLPCSLSVDEYVAAGRTVVMPRPEYPTCVASMTFWSGYEHRIREGGRCSSMWVPRDRCSNCPVTHAPLPAFVLDGRLDVVESVGSVLNAVLGGSRWDPTSGRVRSTCSAPRPEGGCDGSAPGHGSWRWPSPPWLQSWLERSPPHCPTSIAAHWTRSVPPGGRSLSFQDGSVVAGGGSLRRSPEGN